MGSQYQNLKPKKESSGTIVPIKNNSRIKIKKPKFNQPAKLAIISDVSINKKDQRINELILDTHEYKYKNDNELDLISQYLSRQR